MKGKTSMVRSKLFNMDLEAIRDPEVRERIERRIEQIPAWKVERILNDPKAWILRMGKKYVVFESTDSEDKPSDLHNVTLLRILGQNDLYAPSLEDDQNG